MSTGHLAFLGAARFQGYWNAETNAATGSGVSDAVTGPVIGLFKTGSSPAAGYNAATNLTASRGYYWQVTGSGTHNVDGETGWQINDWLIYSGSSWVKLAFEDTIASVILGDMSTSSFHMGAANDQHLIFATGSVFSGSSNLSYNYNTNIVTLPQVALSGDLRILDDRKIYFGSDDDSFIEYNEEGDDFMVISGSSKGLVLSGTTIQIAGTLEGASPLKIGGEIQFTSTGEDAAFNFGTNQDAKIFYRDGDPGLLVISGSSAGISVSGSNVYFDSKIGVGLGPTGEITHAVTLPNSNNTDGAVKANSFISYSSVRYKEDIETLKNPMSVINKLKGVSFKWKDTGNQDYGFIAEDVGKVLPSIVSWEKDETNAQGMEYLKLISFLVEATKKQDMDINQLKHALVEQNKSFNKKLAGLLSSITFILLLLLL